MRYVNLKLRLFLIPGKYYLNVEAPDGTSQLVPTQRLPLEEEALTRLALLATRDGELRTFGSDFFERLFEPAQVRPLYASALERFGKRGEVGVRLQLTPVLEDGAENALPALPWEYLYDGKALTPYYLALEDQLLSLVRCAHKGSGALQTVLKLPVHILSVLANPQVGGRDSAIDVDAERALLEQAVVGAGLKLATGTDYRAAQAAGADVLLTHLDRVPDADGKTHKASREALERFLRDPAMPRPHILHFGCHGSYEDVAPFEGQLLLEHDPPPNKARGKQDPLSARALGQLAVGLSPGLRMVVFNACATAATQKVAALQSVAEAVVRAGVPAAVAMQFDVPQDVAVRFTRDFYGAFFKSLLKGGATIDGALAQARRAIACAGWEDEPYWGIPVLYLNHAGVEPFPFFSGTDALVTKVRNLVSELDYREKEAARLRQLLQPYGPNFPDFLARDLEGAEKRILELDKELRGVLGNGTPPPQP
jgi:hypothetical protein